MRATFRAWEQIFESKAFDLTKDTHSVTATEMKVITGVEPRHLGKMDTSRDVPPVLRNNGYFILPIRNGEYILVRGNGYHQMEAASEVENFQSRIKFPLITAGRGMGEMQYLDHCFNSGALEYVLGETPFFTTIRGRERSGKFGFQVGEYQLQVDGVQIEVDLGLESEQSIALLEAKIGEPSDFVIRQLFYPYKRFLELVPTKQVHPIFFTYDPLTTTYNLWVYKFTDPNDYNAIELVSTRSLCIQTVAPIQINDLKRAEEVSEIIPPQADDVEKIIRFTSLIFEEVNSAAAMAQQMQFDERQSSYYRQAAESLGLVTTVDRQYHLTELGRVFVSKNRVGRIAMLTGLMLDFSLVRIAHELLLSKGSLSRQELEVLIEKNSTLTGSTIGRRAQTLRSWLGWIGETTNTFVEDGDVFKLV